MSKKKQDKHFNKFMNSHDPDEMLREIKHAQHFGHLDSSGSSHIKVFNDKGELITTIPKHKFLPKGTEGSIKKAVLKSGIFIAVFIITLIVTASLFAS